MKNDKKARNVGGFLKESFNDKTLDSELKDLGLARNNTHIEAQLEKITLIQRMTITLLDDYKTNKHLDDPQKRAGSYKRMIAELEDCLELVNKEI